MIINASISIYMSVLMGRQLIEWDPSNTGQDLDITLDVAEALSNDTTNHRHHHDHRFDIWPQMLLKH